jgi:glycine/D-amino acid oxidase-like deaminating enzyme
MISVYPQLREAKVEFAWGGTLDFTLDVMPHAGKIDGMYFAAGFAGHGVAAATWFGAKLAEQICGEPNDIPFDGIKFPAAPFGLRSGSSWALPLAGAWYRILDFFT